MDKLQKPDLSEMPNTIKFVLDNLRMSLESCRIIKMVWDLLWYIGVLWSIYVSNKVIFERFKSSTNIKDYSWGW